MSDETWLREALRAATAAQPPGSGRVSGALRRAEGLRRRRRVTAASCSTAFAVVLAAALTAGGPGSNGLAPVRPDGSPVPAASSGGPPAPAATSGGGDGPAAKAGGRGAAGLGGTPGGSGGHAGTAPDGRDAAAGAPAALDVFFLVDTTAGMQLGADVVRRAVRDIVAHLDARVPLRYGYGRFDDLTPFTATTPVYERLVPLRADAGPLPGLRYVGGGDEPEAHTVALAGVLGWAAPPYTTAPEAAGFGPARRVVVMFTDSSVQQGGQYPDIAAVTERLRAADVRVVTIQLDHPGAARARAYGQLADIAMRTGALAPVTVDCDGDRAFDPDVDVRRGDPFVCLLPTDARGPFTAVADALLRLSR